VNFNIAAKYRQIPCNHSCGRNAAEKISKTILLSEVTIVDRDHNVPWLSS
jgi:hypothetical protein